MIFISTDILSMIENIILDIDETLIHSTTVPLTDKKSDLQFKLGSETYYVHFRPGLSKFLNFVFDNFSTVNIWTAATRPYAQRILSAILTPTQRKKLAFFNSREHTVSGSKPLEMVFNNSSAKKHGILPSNTIIIDDRADVSRHNPGNAIIIPAWKGQRDNYLLKLIVVLQGIISHKLVAHPTGEYLYLTDITN